MGLLYRVLKRKEPYMRKWQKITIGIVIVVLLALHLIIQYAPDIDNDGAVIFITYILTVVTFVTVLIHSFKSSARSDDILDELEELKNENKALRERLDEKDESHE